MNVIYVNPFLDTDNMGIRNRGFEALLPTEKSNEKSDFVPYGICSLLPALINSRIFP